MYSIISVHVGINISGANDLTTLTTHMKVNAKCVQFAPLISISEYSAYTELF
jgi:hypothetical protein